MGWRATGSFDSGGGVKGWKEVLRARLGPSSIPELAVEA